MYIAGGRKEYMALLIRKTELLQRQVTVEDMRNDPNMPPTNNYAYYAGSFEKAAEEAWLKVSLKKEADKPVLSGGKCLVVKVVEQKELSKTEWLEWLWEYSGGVFLDRVALKKKERAKYYQILKVFGHWICVEEEFGEFAKTVKGTQLREFKPAENVESQPMDDKPQLKGNT